MSTVNASLPELEGRRTELYAQLAEVGDFRRGSISENYRRCGKPNCACAQPGHRGHGPRRLWTRSGPGGKTVGRQVSVGEVDKVRRELDAYQRYTELAEEIVRRTGGRASDTIDTAGRAAASKTTRCCRPQPK